MNKRFNTREIELLAPVGTYQDFKQLLESGADAFYMGGKEFNMRMHKKDHNLTNEELKKAVSLAHDQEKKVYITVNSLMNSEEMDEILPFLQYLEMIQPDAIILQDFGLLQMIRKENLNLNMHLSVMANVHNIPMVKRAKELGVTRIVTSRELSFTDINTFVKEIPEMEYEYFIHGDMCSVHGSQCYYSGMLFGKSSNRGLCMKPCRWSFINKNGATQYDLAVKDICLYRHIPELILSGINSFKIEGRMRGNEYMLSIINAYRTAIDRYIHDPLGYHTNQQVSKTMHQERVRNLSTAYAFGKPGQTNIDITGEREPKIFSKAVNEISIDDPKISQVKKVLHAKNPQNNNRLELIVKVNSLEAANKAYDAGADSIYLAGEVFKPNNPFTLTEIEVVRNYAKNSKVFYVLPRMAYERQLQELTFTIPKLKGIGIDGLVVGNLGELAEFKCNDLEFRGDYSLNILNEYCANFYQQQGLNSVTISVETAAENLKKIASQSKTPIELIVQGAIVVMYLEHCIVAAKHQMTSNNFCKDFCKSDSHGLLDENHVLHQVLCDQYCKNHIITTKDVCYLPILKELIDLGIHAFRIEGQHYTPDQVGALTSIYRKCFEELDQNHWELYNSSLVEITNREQSFHGFNY